MDCFMSLRLMPRILMGLLFFGGGGGSTTEVNYCLPFGKVRKTAIKLRIVDVAADTAIEHHPNSRHLLFCVSEYSCVTFQHHFVSVKFYITVGRRHKL
jgi:hypothetical protein